MLEYDDVKLTKMLCKLEIHWRRLDTSAKVYENRKEISAILNSPVGELQNLLITKRLK